MKPLLVLGTRGVVSPVGEHPPEHYRMVDLIDKAAWGSKQTGRRARALSRVFETVWCSRCGDEINLFGAVLGIPAFDPLEISDEPEHNSDDFLDAVRERAHGRPCAWVSAFHGGETLKWAAERQQPTLLVGTDPAVGLTESEMKKLVSFSLAVDRHPMRSTDLPAES